MSRAGRLVVLAVAWVIPVAWIAVALFSGPSDGITISPPTALSGAGRWGDTVTVVDAYGDTVLRDGDIILKVDGRSFGDWASGAPDEARAVGDEIAYEVRRRGASLPRILNLRVELTHYPLASALGHNVAPVALALMLLVAGTVAFWFRPEAAATRSFLAAGALLPTGLTSYPLGLGALDLAGGRGVWPQLGGELLFALGLGALLVTALTFVSVPDWLRRHPWALPPAFAVPLVGYAAWALAFAAHRDPGAARLQALLTVAAPAAAVAAPGLLLVLVHGYVRSNHRQDRLALRLALLALGGGLAVRLLLDDLPREVVGRPLLPGSLQFLVLAPAILACLVAALLRFRLDEVEAGVRRSLVQAGVAALVGAAFVGVAGAVNLASDTSFDDMVAGGVVALLLLPLALALNRVVRRMVYGDREFPHRVVADLRRLDPLTDPGDALQETLALLARRLRLSYAAIEVFGATDSDRIATAIGDPRGHPTTVDLETGGTRLGRLRLEVAADRDPFGPGDRRLLEDVGSQVGALVQAVSINRELQRSRQSIVAAREEERRRIRRDLHDGLGPSLATLAMRLEMARDLIPVEPDEAAELVGQLSEQTRTGIDEVRRLVDGLRPPALDQFGLVSALRQRADEHNLAARSGPGPGTLTWAVDAADDLEPLPAAVEVAAYRIVTEAVNNAVRHSEAETCVVRLRRAPDALLIRISDAGTGVASDPTPGVGLGSMRERAEELGGSCTLISTAGLGTVVDVRLPLTATPGDRRP